MKKVGLLFVCALVNAAERSQKEIECVMLPVEVNADDQRIVLAGPWPEKGNDYRCAAVVNSLGSYDHLRAIETNVVAIAMRDELNRFFSDSRNVSLEKVRGFVEVLPCFLQRRLLERCSSSFSGSLYGCSIALLIASLSTCRVLCAHIGESSILGFDSHAEIVSQSIPHTVNYRPEEERLKRIVTDPTCIKVDESGRKRINKGTFNTTASRWIGLTALSSSIVSESDLPKLRMPTITVLHYEGFYGVLLGKNCVVRDMTEQTREFFKGFMKYEKRNAEICQSSLEGAKLSMPQNVKQGAAIFCALRQNPTKDCIIM